MDHEIRDQVMRETLAHVRRVGELITHHTTELNRRSVEHDDSKFGPDEFDSFVEATPAMKGTTFGSDEYKAGLAKIRPAIDHHNKHNRHHPEHHENGIAGMTLVDVIEMLCDWKAASERHEDADFDKSIAHCVERFKIDPQLRSILENTARWFAWID